MARARAASRAPAGRSGRQSVYAVDPGPLAEVDVWLAPYRRLWNDSLDALGRHLDRTATEQE